ncbi:MAG: hypothetical protein V4651_08350 [Bacteroidota bacterium]
MKSFTTLVVLALTLCCANTYAQTKTYHSTSGEMIFSFATIQKGGNQINSNLRWSPVFNFQGLNNYDFTQHFGFFHGLAIRNVGFIYEIPGTDTLKKHRTYNLGIPVGFKLGKLENGTFLYGGYEFELPFHYKEKLFINDEKEDVSSVWFSNRVNWYTQSVFVGINFPRGFNVKFKYYLDSFFNKNATETINGVQSKPFANFDAHVFYIAIDWNVFKDVKEYGRKKRKQQQTDEKSYSYNLSNNR